MKITGIILKVYEKRGEDTNPKDFTTEDTEKKNFRFFKSSVSSVVTSSKNVGRLKDGVKKLYYESSERGGNRLSRKLYI